MNEREREREQESVLERASPETFRNVKERASTPVTLPSLESASVFVSSLRLSLYQFVCFYECGEESRGRSPGLLSELPEFC